MLTVYLSNEYIRVMTGDGAPEHLRVNQVYQMPDVLDVIQKGVLVREEELLEQMKKLWDKLKLPRNEDVTLVMDSDPFHVQLMEVPVMKDAQMVEYVGRELTGVERIPDPVYGFFPVENAEEGAALQRVFVMLASREIIKPYVELFKKIGIQLKDIQSSFGSIMHLLKILPQIEKKTCVLQFLDDHSLTNVLIVDGKYRTFNGVRLFSEPGTPAYAMENAKAVNSLLYFAATRQVGRQVTDIFVSGVKPKNFQLIKDSICEMQPALNVELLKPGANFSCQGEVDNEEFFAENALLVGGFMRANERTSIGWQMRYTPEQLEKKKKFRKTVFPLLVGFGCLAAVAFGSLGRQLWLTWHFRSVEKYNQSEKATEITEEYELLQKRLQASASIQEGIESAKALLDTYPQADSSVKKALQACARGLAEVELVGYDSATGILSFNSQSDQVEKIHEFVDRLLEEKLFEEVNYSGYDQTSGESWNIRVSCRLAPQKTGGTTDEAESEP